jgi:hypothetical protein
MGHLIEITTIKLSGIFRVVFPNSKPREMKPQRQVEKANRRK